MNNAIEWDENDVPVATRFDDPYYSKHDGRAETHHVFINGNQLLPRFEEAKNFHVAELGFGTGLNFYETLSHWNKHACEGAHLTFTSFELYPLSREEMTRALQPWPDLAALSAPFLDALSRQDGWQEIMIENVTLRLAVGDANQLIHQMPDLADAWFLDGFSPAKNPELWNEGLMNALGQKTKLGGTFATYTAAGWVRRMMGEAGFQVERIKGFGHKRHMSVGYRVR
ncbi:MAG: tRNA (5-methylaminomethyl-2-thiouridine)(34)-methyltransferase MnmD [Hyphomicrobiales bacterium]